MLKHLTPYIRFALMAGALTALVIANSREQGFREKLLDYIDDNALTEETKLRVVRTHRFFLILTNGLTTFPTARETGMIISSLRAIKTVDGEEKPVSLYECDDVRINTYGSLNLDLNYGKVDFHQQAVPGV